VLDRAEELSHRASPGGGASARDAGPDRSRHRTTARSGASARRSGTHQRAGRSFVAPRPRTRSRTDRTGTEKANICLRLVDTPGRAGPRDALARYARPFEGSVERRANVGERAPGDRRLADEYDVGSGLDARRAHRLTQETARAVAFHGVADARSDREPDASGARRIGRQSDASDQRARAARPRAEDAREVSRGGQSERPRHPECGAATRR